MQSFAKFCKIYHVPITVGATAVNATAIGYMIVIFVLNSPICGIFFSVLILRNLKSSLYPKKCCYQVTRMILALMRIVLCMKIVFKRVKLQFIMQFKTKNIVTILNLKTDPYKVWQKSWESKNRMNVLEIV